MKKILLFLAVMLSAFFLISCSSNSEKKETEITTEEESALNQKPSEIAEHQDIRLKFNDVHIALLQDEFKGGTTIEELKTLFGEPTAVEQEPAGEVSLDVYKWQFDNVEVTVKLYENSTVVRSISNFSFIRKASISKETYNEIAEGTSYLEVKQVFGEPDVLSEVSSSDGRDIQAIWISGLKSDGVATVEMFFNQDGLVSKEQSGLKEDKEDEKEKKDK
ncbi:DUF3862 domain-containing protein [Streptococcus sp. CSL10205-OR2]|uniref:DUF3862 domain-containing protein n=1 Tax=Streptococcus sp. CSL10205-OR2 TaxID=2980558 RepID=UPI0021DABE5C|nr:DUF3862 domain-containing protein [Streptococcus sp. CSL10205-OR2]MCU9533329.1 DUF3862 domain-containing protein [Streptococcus sp. CSL10205-OR2]